MRKYTKKEMRKYKNMGQEELDKTFDKVKKRIENLESKLLQKLKLKNIELYHARDCMQQEVNERIYQIAERYGFDRRKPYEWYI